jgi:hypothetical protein
LLNPGSSAKKSRWTGLDEPVSLDIIRMGYVEGEHI